MSNEKEKEKGTGAVQQGQGNGSRAIDRPDGGQAASTRRGPSAPAVWSTDPFAVAQRLIGEMDRVFENFGFGRHGMAPWSFGQRSRPAAGGQGLDWAPWSPEVEVFKRGDQFVVRADLPGLTKDQVHVEVTDDAVTIQGERRQEHEDRREGYYHSERSYGSFYRSIPLPEGAQADKADANFKDGVLEVTMPAPRLAEHQGRRIEIKG